MLPLARRNAAQTAQCALWPSSVRVPPPYYNRATSFFFSKFFAEDAGVQKFAIEASVVDEPYSYLPNFIVSFVERATEFRDKAHDPAQRD